LPIVIGSVFGAEKRVDVDDDGGGDDGDDDDGRDNNDGADQVNRLMNDACTWSLDLKGERVKETRFIQHSTTA